MSTTTKTPTAPEQPYADDVQGRDVCSATGACPSW